MSHEALRKIAAMDGHRAMVDIADVRALVGDRDNMVKLNRLLRDRPDLGNRAKEVDALIRENERLMTQLLQEQLKAMNVEQKP